MKDYYNYNYEDTEITLKVIEAKGKCIAGHKVGQTWRFGSKETPKGLCSWAYTALFPYISAIAFGGKLPWEKKKGYATACCSDPVNLVTFEIKAGKKIVLYRK